MAFKMNVSSCQVTAVSNGLNGRAGEYVQALSTEPALISTDLTPAFKQDLALPSKAVETHSAQTVASVKIPDGNGKVV